MAMIEMSGFGCVGVGFVGGGGLECAGSGVACVGGVECLVQFDTSLLLWPDLATLIKKVIRPSISHRSPGSVI